MNLTIAALIAALLIVGGVILHINSEQPKKAADQKGLEVATFAGGCFWCMEAILEAQEGVAEAVSGYTGGELSNPTYEQVCSGTTGHVEAVQVHYDPSKITSAID